MPSPIGPTFLHRVASGPFHNSTFRPPLRERADRQAANGQFGGFITTVEVAAVMAAIRDSLLFVPSGPPMT